MEVVLKEPVDNLDGNKLTVVNVRPKMLVGDWRAAGKAAGTGATSEERTFHIVCRLAGLPDIVVERMCMADFNAIVNVIDVGDGDPKAP